MSLAYEVLKRHAVCLMRYGLRVACSCRGLGELSLEVPPPYYGIVPGLWFAQLHTRQHRSLASATSLCDPGFG